MSMITAATSVLAGARSPRVGCRPGTGDAIALADRSRGHGRRAAGGAIRRQERLGGIVLSARIVRKPIFAEARPLPAGAGRESRFSSSIPKPTAHATTLPYYCPR